MYDTGSAGPGRRRRLRPRRVARERAAAHAIETSAGPVAIAGGAVGRATTPAGGAAGAPEQGAVTAGVGLPPALADALAAVDAGLDLLAGVDLAVEDGRAALEGTVQVQRLANRLAALHLDVIGRADQSCAYLDDGAATLAGWLRPRTRLDAGDCARRMTAATRLWRFPTLAAAARAGEVTLRHVTAVTSAAVPRRAAAVAKHDEALTLLARHAPPRDLRIALGRIADQADRDGTDRPPEPFGPDGRDPRCELWVRPGIDGLGDVQATLSQLDTEGLLTLLDALEVPDPPDTPDELRRTAAQRRGDAFGELIRRALAHGLAPTVHGVKPQVLLAVDLAALLPGACRDGLDLADVLAKAGITDDMLAAAGIDPATLQPLDTDNPEEPAAENVGDRPGGTADAGSGGQPPAGGRPGDGEKARAGGQPDPDGNGDDARAGDQPGYQAGDGPQRHDDHQTAVRQEGGSGTGDGDPAAADHPIPPAPAPPPPSRPRARLRFTGDLDLGLVRRLLLGDAAVRCVLTMGPWRTVAVGRTFRTLPAWLRPLLDLVHHHCRGPDCDRPITWTQAHHQTAWVQLGDTDVNQTIPLCVRHHDLVTTGGWDARLHPDTGVVTWTSPHGTIHHTRPPP